MSRNIDISKLDKAEVLAALYNASKPLGMGFMQFEAKPMTREEAAGLLTKQQYFDYLKGRVMKTAIQDSLDPWGYDRDNGDGAAARAIAALQASGDVNPESIAQTSKDGTRREAARINTKLGEEYKMEVRDGIAVMTLGLADVAHELAPAVNKAVEDL